MTEVPIKGILQQQRKEALLGKDKQKLTMISLVLSAIKQYEVDHQQQVDEGNILDILAKMLKERRDDFAQFQAINREDKMAETQYEIDFIQSFLPEPFSAAEVEAIIEQAIKDLGVSSPKEMGKVMEQIRPALKGRADMRLVSDIIKQKLAG